MYVLYFTRKINTNNGILKNRKIIEYLEYVKGGKKDHSQSYRHKRHETVHVIVIKGVRILIENHSANVEIIIYKLYFNPFENSNIRNFFQTLLTT